MQKLLHSRKFWLMVWGLIQTIAGHYLTIPHDIILAADGLVLALIASIAYEDGEAAKADATLNAAIVTTGGNAPPAAPGQSEPYPSTNVTRYSGVDPQGK